MIYPELTYTCRDNIVDQAIDVMTFAKARPAEISDRTRLKHYYDQMASISAIPWLCKASENKYAILEAAEAVGWYFTQIGPKAGTPRKTMQALSDFSERVLSEFSEPKGNVVSVTQLQEALGYLEERYRFLERVFGKECPVFSIINNSSRIYNALCCIGDSPHGTQTSIFLYAATGISPEAVLFHELGHCFHIRLTGSKNVIPVEILEYLAQYGFETLATVSAKERCEIFADILSIGMMYDSPFEGADPFTSIAETDKKAYHELVKNLINYLPN